MSFLKGALGRTVVLAVVAGAAIYYMLTLLVGTGVKLPFAPKDDYTASFQTNNVANLVPYTDVEIAGVRVGKVQTIDNAAGHATITFTLDPDVTPLHSGMTVRVGAKSVVGESYVDLQDGTGPAVQSGYVIPAASVKPAVELGDVLRSLDPKTRDALGELSRSLGASTNGTETDVSNLMTGLGQLGDNGYTALDALAAQSNDLTAVSQQTAKILAALDTGEGQIGTLVRNAQQLSGATAGQSQNIEATMRSLPSTLSSARSAVTSLTQLGQALAPVASDLRNAAPDLNAALNQLPGATKSLRDLLPSLNGTLQEAPGTLNRVPGLSQDLVNLVPQLQTTMANLNPMLGYLQPYGHDIAAFFVNFGAILQYSDEAGVHFTRLLPAEGNEAVVKGVPLTLPDILSYKNAYPAPGGALHPGPGGQFTKLYPESK